MTPEQKLLTKVVFAACLLVGVFFSGVFVRGYVAELEATKVALETAEQVNKQLGQYAQDLKGLADRNQVLQDRITALDREHTGRLNEKLAENSALRRDLDVAQRMRLKGTTCPKARAGSDAASSSGMGDGAGVELSAATRLAVWDLRESILSDQAKLAYLQEERRTLTCSPQVQKTPE